MHFLQILVQPHHLQMQLLHPHLFLERHTLHLLLLGPAALLALLVAHVVLDEVFAELAHALSVLAVGLVAEDAGAPPVVDLGLRVEVGDIDDMGGFIGGVVASLGEGESTSLFLCVRELISLEIYSKSWLPLSGVYRSYISVRILKLFTQVIINACHLLNT